MRRSKKLAIACGVVAVGVAVALLSRGTDRSPASKKPLAAERRRVPRMRVARSAAPVGVPDRDVELPRLLPRIEDADDAPSTALEACNNADRERITAEPLFGEGEAGVPVDPWRPSTKAPPLRTEPIAPRVGKVRDAFDEPLERRQADGRASEESSAATAPLVYRVQKGDTLSSLAARYLGSSERFWELFKANRDRLRNPDLLPVGLEIRIPLDGTAPRTVPPPTIERPLTPLSRE